VKNILDIKLKIVETGILHSYKQTHTNISKFFWQNFRYNRTWHINQNSKYFQHGSTNFIKFLNKCETFSLEKISASYSLSLNECSGNNLTQKYNGNETDIAKFVSFRFKFSVSFF